MNYRHAFHAGNFADVHKHVALAAILLHLGKKNKPFAIVDTHAGRGLYDLSGEEAARTSESAGGIGKLIGCAAQSPAVAQYLEIVRQYAPRYPGSPPIAAKLLRPQDRLIAVEKHPQEFEALRLCLAPCAAAHPILADGYRELSRLLPPPERRGAVLIDPPYEQPDEASQIAQAIAAAYRRFPTGIYLVWHPLKCEALAERLAGELMSMGPSKLLSLALDVGVRGDDAPGRLAASGLFVVNPPYGFDNAMEAAHSELLPHLARGAGARAAVNWLSGGP